MKIPPRGRLIFFCPVPGCESECEGGKVCAAHTIMARSDADYIVRQLHHYVHKDAIAFVRGLKDLPANAPELRKGTMKAKVKAEPIEIKKPAAKAALAAPQPSNPLAGHSWTLEVEHGRLRGSQTNPRKVFKEEALQTMAESLKTKGQLQALLVRVDPLWAGKEIHNKKRSLSEARAFQLLAGKVNADTSHPAVVAVAKALMEGRETKFEIVAGERRWRSAGAKYANLKKMLVTVRCLTDEQVIEAQYVENLEREDLTPMEEAEGFKALVDSGKYSPDDLAKKFDRPRSYIFERLKLARLEGKLKTLLKEGKITPTLGAVIAAIPDEKSQARFVKESLYAWRDRDNPISVTEAKRVIESEYMRSLKHAGWGLDDFFAYPGAVHPHCAKCPAMTRNMTDENPDLAKGPARCVNVTCFEARKAQRVEQIRAEAKRNGQEIWSTPEELNGKHYNAAYVWEGEKNGYDNGSKSWESIAAKAPDVKPILAVTDSGIKRVWRKSELEKAGAFKGESRERIGPSPAQKQAQRDKSRFENLVQEQSLVYVVRGLRGYPGGGTGPDFVEIELAILRAMVTRNMGYDERREQKVDEWNARQCLENLAQIAFKEWYDFTRPPKLVTTLIPNLETVKNSVKNALEDKRKLTSLEDLEKPEHLPVDQTKVAPQEKPGPARPPAQPGPKINGHVRPTGHLPAAEAEPGALGIFLDSVANRAETAEVRK